MDDRLRQLERSVAAGDPGARAALLAELLRLDRVDPERVALAAYCGDADARAAAPGAPWALHASTFAPHERHEALAGFLAGLSRWGTEVRIRAAVAAAWVALDGWLSTRQPALRRWRNTLVNDGRGGWRLKLLRHDVIVLDSAPDGFRHYAPLRAIEAAEAWLTCPCNEHQSAAQDAASTGELRITFESAWWRQLSNLMLLDQCLQASQCLEALAMSASRLVAPYDRVRNEIQAAIIDWAKVGGPSS